MVNRKPDELVGRMDAGEEEGEGELDLAKIRRFAGFFLRAPRRHPGLAIGLFLGAIAITACLVAWLPRTYTSELRVVAHRSIVLQPHDGAAPLPDPTLGVTDDVMKRDNLVGLIQDLDLVRRWDETRPPMLRLKDSILAVFRGPTTPEGAVRAMVAVLEKRLLVWTDQPTSSISMRVDWPTPQMALEIVNAAYKRFLDARYKSEVSVYVERLHLLEMRAQFSAQDVDAAIADLTKLEQERRNAAIAGAAQAGSGAPRPAPGPRPAAAAAAPGPPPNDDTTHALETVRGQIRAREDEWHRRIADVESQLADAEASLGPLHPTVLALKRKAEVVHETPPELEALRQNERQLVATLATMTQQPTPAPDEVNGTPPSVAGASSPPPAPAPVSPPASSGPPSPVNTLLDALGPRDDPSTAYARSKLQAVSQTYNDLLNRMQLAKVELDEAQRSFRETYSIHQPAELPVRPRKPNMILIALAGLVLGVLLAFLVPGARDLLRGRVLEAWQVEALLKLPILGQLPPTIEPPPEPGADPSVAS